VTGVLRQLVHVCGTGCKLNYVSVIVSDRLNGCSRLICLVLETAALCDIFVRSAVYKSYYLLTYLLTYATVHVASVSYRSGIVAVIANSTVHVGIQSCTHHDKAQLHDITTRPRQHPCHIYIYIA